MAVKRKSAFDQALIEAQAAGAGNEVEQAAQAPVEEAPASFLPVSARAQTIEETEAEQRQDTDKKKGGRPKGEPKVKKTFYLATPTDLLQKSQLGIAQQLGIFIKDESQMADLAFVLLEHLLATGSQTEKGKILEAYQRLKK